MTSVEQSAEIADGASTVRTGLLTAAGATAGAGGTTVTGGAGAGAGVRPGDGPVTTGVHAVARRAEREEADRTHLSRIGPVAVA